MANKGTLKPFEKGKSGNPLGRPKEPPVVKDFKAWCKRKCTEPGFYDEVWKLAKKHPQLLLRVLDYGCGKPTETVDILNVKSFAPIVVPARATPEEWAEIVKLHQAQEAEGGGG